MLGVALIYVAMVLINNGVVRYYKMDPKVGAFLNIVAGVISVYINFTTLALAEVSANYYAAGTGLLFGITYLFIGFIAIFDWQDLRPYGWYSLFVTINAVICGFYGFQSDWRMSIIWWLWALLWFTGFVETVWKKDLKNFVPFLQVFCGIFTAWIPGFLMLIDKW